MKNLLLASQSPRRRELLALLGLPFTVTSPNVAEVPQTDEPPTGLVVRLSRAKAHAVTARSDDIIIACDTVVVLDGELLGKPRDATEATAMLRRLGGRSHTVYSAVTLRQAQGRLLRQRTFRPPQGRLLLEMTTGRALTSVAETQVTMRAYTDAEIATYVISGDPLDKAGAYAIQHSEFHPVAELQGCYANVMGLPLCHLTRCLRTWRIEPLHDVPVACQTHTGHDCAAHATILDGQ